MEDFVSVDPRITVKYCSTAALQIIDFKLLVLTTIISLVFYGFNNVFTKQWNSVIIFIYNAF